MDHDGEEHVGGGFSNSLWGQRLAAARHEVSDVVPLSGAVSADSKRRAGKIKCHSSVGAKSSPHPKASVRFGCGIEICVHVHADCVASPEFVGPRR